MSGGEDAWPAALLGGRAISWVNLPNGESSDASINQPIGYPNEGMPRFRYPGGPPATPTSPQLLPKFLLALDKLNRKSALSVHQHS